MKTWVDEGGDIRILPDETERREQELAAAEESFRSMQMLAWAVLVVVGGLTCFTVAFVMRIFGGL